MKTYTTQQDAHGNVIVCGDEIARRGYVIVASGTYAECLARKVAMGTGRAK